MADDASILAIVLPQLRGFEGCRLRAYQDTMGVWTVGFGCTSSDIGPDTVWTQEQADEALAERAGALPETLDAHISWWRKLDAVRGAILVEMAYQLGAHGLMGFPHMLGYLQALDYANAAAQMLNSTWATQTPNRAKALALQMETGKVAA